MSKPIYFLPWAMRMVIILCLVITHIQQDSLVYILSAFTLILIVFCIWGCSKSKTQNILKALTGNRTQNIFDVVMSALFIIIGLYCKDTTTVIEGGALLTISVINIISPIKYQKSGSSVNSIDSQQNEINPHKRNDYPLLNSFTKVNKLHDKCNQVRCVSLFYKQLIPLLVELCKLFSHNPKPIHALLASKRRLIDLQKVPFKTLTNALLKSN